MATKKKNAAQNTPVGTGMVKVAKDTIVERRKQNCVKSGGTWDAQNLRCNL